MKMNSEDLKIVKDFKREFFEFSMQAFDKHMNNRPENKMAKVPHPPAPKPKNINFMTNKKLKVTATISCDLMIDVNQLKDGDLIAAVKRKIDNHILEKMEIIEVEMKWAAE